MPLRDHVHSPVDDFTSWEGFHGGWPMVIVQQLARCLPNEYVASPRVHSGQVEIDVATYRQEEPPPFVGDGSNEGGVTTAVWAVPRPTLNVETAWPDHDEYEVRIYDAQRGRQLVAAIEIVSPANKDRAEHRNAFVGKCATLLHQGVAVSIIDLVTTRHFNLYAELLAFLGQSDPTLGGNPPLYAVSCRWLCGRQRGVFQAWSHPLALGQPLPTLPLWLSEQLVLPLDLEASYEQTCRDLRIA